MAHATKGRVSGGTIVQGRPQTKADIERKRREDEQRNTVRKPKPANGNGGFKKSTNGFAAKGGKGFGK